MNTILSPQILPSDAEVMLARESGRVLSASLQTKAEVRQLDVYDGSGSVNTVRVPDSALRLLLEILTEIGQGNAVSIIPVQAELTTQEAADVLNVSRPFFVQLLDKGEIPFRKVGTHRRVYYQDVSEYKKRMAGARMQTLDALVAQGQEWGMGY